MNLVQRVQDVLLKPKETWPAIAAEATSIGAIYREYLVFLAAIPALAGFIGMSLIGLGGFGVSLRVPVLSGLVQMVLSYALSLAMVYVMSLVVNALAPSFGGSKDPLAAFKLVAYAMTAAFVGGVFSLVPMLGMLGLIAALYSVYLLYTGIAPLMKCPPDKAGAYTAVVVVCGIVLGVVMAVLLAAVTPGMGAFGAGRPGGGDVVINTPDGEVRLDTSKMEAMARQMEEAGKRMEQAQMSGDTEAAGKALGEMMGAMTGAAGTPLPPQELKALLPEALGTLKREAIEAQSNNAMGLGASTAEARYAEGEQRVKLSITDVGGGLGGLAALAWANATLDRETETKIERVYKQGARTVREEHRKDGSRSEYTVLLKNGVVVEAEGRRVDAAALKAIVEGLDLGKLEAMQRPAKS